MGEAGAEDEVVSDEDDMFDESVYEIFRDNLITRAPDKMIDYFQGNIMLAFRNCIY